MTNVEILQAVLSCLMLLLSAVSSLALGMGAYFFRDLKGEVRLLRDTFATHGQQMAVVVDRQDRWKNHDERIRALEQQT